MASEMFVGEGQRKRIRKAFTLLCVTLAISACAEQKPISQGEFIEDGEYLCDKEAGPDSYQSCLKYKACLERSETGAQCGTPPMRQLPQSEINRKPIPEPTAEERAAQTAVLVGTAVVVCFPLAMVGVPCDGLAP